MYDELKQIFNELKINLQNPILSNKIQKEVPNFDYVGLRQSITNYLNNFNTLENSDDELISQISQKAKELLKLTNSEHIELYKNQFINLSLFLNDHTPNRTTSINTNAIYHENKLAELIEYLKRERGYSQKNLIIEPTLDNFRFDIGIVDENYQTLAYIELKIKNKTNSQVNDYFTKIFSDDKNLKLKFFYIIYNQNEKIYYESQLTSKTFQKRSEFPKYLQLRDSFNTNTSANSWDDFIKQVNFNILSSIEKGEKSTEADKIRNFLKLYLSSLQRNIKELSSFKIQLNQATTQQYYTSDNGFRGGFYLGQSYSESTQLNITFWASWGGGVFIKDNQNIFFSNKQLIEEAKIQFPTFEFDENAQHIFALNFNPPTLPTEKEVQHAIKQLLEIYIFFGILEKQPQTSNSIDIINQPKLIIESKETIKPSFGVENIADTLSNVISNFPDDSGMMIGIFGVWGRGKTYLAKKTWEQIKIQRPEYEKIEFSAWKYQDTKASWAYLYEICLEEYLKDNLTQNSSPINLFWIKIKKIFLLNKTKYGMNSILFFIVYTLICFIWAFLMDKFAIFWSMWNILGVTVLILVFKVYLFYKQHKNSAISLFKKYFSKTSFKDILGLQSEIQNELRSLLQTWILTITATKKIVLFVDDLDRCQTSQMINIIDGLRVILDDKDIYSRLIIITSVDDEILKKAFLNQKNIFNSDQNQNSTRDFFKEYLEKVFLIGIKLDGINEEESKEFLNNLIHIDKIKTTITSETPLHSSTHQEKTHIKGNTTTSNTTKENNNDDDSNIFEITDTERNLLEANIMLLQNPTPRKIRIFYYQYLISKQLLKNDLEPSEIEILIKQLLCFDEKMPSGPKIIKMIKMVGVL